MTDFPSPGVLPLFIHTFSPGTPPKSDSTGTPGSLALTANQATYIPFSIPWPYPVNRVFWCNGSSTTGNTDFGIYTPGGFRIYSTGSTAGSGTTVPQYVTPGTPFVLPAGQYYFAFSSAGTTNRAIGIIPGTNLNAAMAGFLAQATAFPLPSTATFATAASTARVLCGITRTASGF